jgi:heat-inducible transcriptional repressor
LEQPHTSAGRVPSDKAYRLYVDKLMRVRSLDDQEAEYIKDLYRDKIMQLEQVILQTAKVLSDITSYTSIALAPQLSKVVIRHIQLVPVDKDFALLVVVTSSGILKDTLIRIPEGIHNDFLNKVSNILNEQFQGKTFSEIDIKDLSLFRKVFAENQNFLIPWWMFCQAAFRNPRKKRCFWAEPPIYFDFRNIRTS